MPFELRQLRFAVVAGETRSFAEAARKLCVKQTTLSKRIALLEQRLGVTLFERSTQGAVPTKMGADFLETARRIVEEIDALRISARAMGRGEAGTLTFGFSTSLSASHLRATLLDFVHRFPGVELIGIEGGHAELERGLMSRLIDIALIPGKLMGVGLQRRHLWPERWLVALPEEHMLAEADRIYWHDLRNENFVVPAADPGPDAADLLRVRLAEPGLKPDIAMRSVSRENILNMVSTGRFLTLVCDTASGVKYPGTVLREIHDTSGLAHVDFTAFWRDGNDNPALKSLFSVIGERYPAFAGP